MADVVLGIETSCDETSAAVLVGGATRPPELASLVILSQDIHQVFGGVVPELASRAHLAALPAVVDRARAEAGLAWSAIDAVAVTAGPGLVGALLVGVVYGKALAYEDVFTKIDMCRKHYAACGLGEGFVDQFIR